MGFRGSRRHGRAMARPDEPVWAISGGRPFQMNMAEIATLVQEGLEVSRRLQQRLPRHGAAVAQFFHGGRLFEHSRS